MYRNMLNNDYFNLCSRSQAVRPKRFEGPDATLTTLLKRRAEKNIYQVAYTRRAIQKSQYLIKRRPVLCFPGFKHLPRYYARHGWTIFPMTQRITYLMDINSGVV